MEESNINQASKKRLLISWYIDFLFFMTLWGLLSYFIGSIGYSFLSIEKSSMCVEKIS